VINKKENTFFHLGNFIFLFFFFVSLLSFSNRSEKLTYTLKKEIHKTFSVRLQKTFINPINENISLKGEVLQQQLIGHLSDELISLECNHLVNTRYKLIQKLQLKIKPSLISTHRLYFHHKSIDKPSLKA